MDNHQNIVGARKLSQSEVELINQLKAKGEELRELMARVESYITEQHEHAGATNDISEMERLQDADPYHWHASAKHSLQAGIMLAVRAIAQPTTF